jgi:hypothetical protein
VSKQAFEVWTIYRHPLDYPQGYVVRRAVVGGDRSCDMCLANVPHGTPAVPCALADRAAHYAKDLPGARSVVPLGKYRLPRVYGDDPAILEVWL